MMMHRKMIGIGVAACLVVWVFRLVQAPEPVEKQAPVIIRSIPVPEPEEPKVVADPYAGHEIWCAPEGRPDCLEDAECPTGTKCIRPFYKNHRECTVPWPSKEKRGVMRERLAQVGREIGVSSTARLVVQHQASRESTYRPTVVHGRDPDTKAAYRSWQKERPRYEGSPYYKVPRKWATLGMFGMNSALWVWEWDPMAPPSVLCLESASYETYVRRMRRAWRKYNYGLACARGEKATWWDLVRAASMGKICPSSNAKVAKIRGKFERFMHSQQRDPYRKPKLSELGKRREGMVWVREIEEALDRAHPIPK